jgi:hypothetical protein
MKLLTRLLILCVSSSAASYRGVLNDFSFSKDIPPMSRLYLSIMTGNGWYLAAKMVLSEYGICDELIFVFIYVMTLKLFFLKHKSIERCGTNAPLRSYDNSAPGTRGLMTWMFCFVATFIFQ